MYHKTEISRSQVIWCLICTVVGMLGFLFVLGKDHDDHEPKAKDVLKISRIEICDTVHIVRGTTYQPTIAQCDSTPFSTADGSRIIPGSGQRWVALSRDLIYDEPRQDLFSRTDHWRGAFRFGDTITVYSETHPQINGDWCVRDCMSPRYQMSIDFLGTITPKLGVATDVKIITCSEKY